VNLPIPLDIWRINSSSWLSLYGKEGGGRKLSKKGKGARQHGVESFSAPSSGLAQNDRIFEKREKKKGEEHEGKKERGEGTDQRDHGFVWFFASSSLEGEKEKREGEGSHPCCSGFSHSAALFSLARPKGEGGKKKRVSKKERGDTRLFPCISTHQTAAKKRKKKRR